MPLRADGFHQHAFFLGDGFPAPHELDVRRADVRDDGNLGLSHLGQGLNLTRMIHAHLQHGDFIRGASS